MSYNNLKINLSQNATDNEKMTIFLNGSLDNYNYKEFVLKINKLIKENPVNFIFDCSNLHYISASGLGAFMEILRKVKRYDGTLSLVSIQPQVFEVFELLGFSNFINIINSAA